MDLKKLMRGALEPARVFGRRDFDPKAAPAVLHYQFRGQDYWSPGYPTWIVIDGDCKVLERAIQRYGMREAPVSVGWDEFALKLLGLKPKTRVQFAELEFAEFELSGSGVILTGVEVGPRVFPGTPIAYAQRRFGAQELSYYADGEYLKIATANGIVVVVVRALRIGSAALWGSC